MKTIVKDVMTTRVIWVRKDAPFRELAAALRRHRVSAFPVLGEDDKVIGVVSEADMLTKEALDPGVFSGLLHHRDAEKARGITAGDLMTAPAVTVAPEDTVEQAARLMYQRKVKRLPVVDGTVTWSASSAGPTCWPSSTGRIPTSARKSSTRSSSANFSSTRRLRRRRSATVS